MSLQSTTRDGFFPSSGAVPTSSPPAYDGYWTDTSQADRVGAAWDVQTSTAFSSVTPSWTFSGSNPPPTYTALVRQYVFPAFGAIASVMQANPGIAPALGIATASGSSSAAQRTPINRTKGTITGGSGTRTALLAIVAKVVDSTGALRWVIGRTNAATGVNPFQATLTGRSYGVFTYTSGNQNLIPAATDSLVLELGVSLRNFSLTAVTYDLQSEFGDSAAQLLFNGDTAQDNAGFRLTYWITAASSATLGWTFTKPNIATVAARRIQSPSVAIATSNSLNEFILN